MGWLQCGVLCFVKHVVIDVRVLVGWKRGAVLYGDDCGWLCIELGAQLSMGCGTHWVGVVGKM